MLFAVCSDRGSPGSTSATLALAAARGLPALVVEADPYGGDLALRCQPGGHPMAPTPTVLALGAGRAERPPAHAQLTDATSNQERRRLDLWHDGSHELNSLLRVVPGFLTAEQGATLAWPAVTATLELQTAPVFADLGRIHVGSPSMPLACAADALIVVCRGDMASVQHMMWRLEHLVPAVAERNGRPPVVIALVVASRRNGARAARQVAELLGETPVAPAVRGTGWLAWDPASLVGLQEGADPWTKPLRGSPLMKSARNVMGLLGAVTSLEYSEPVIARKWTHRRRRSADERRTVSLSAGLDVGVTLEPSAEQPTAPPIDDLAGNRSGRPAEVPGSETVAANNGAKGASGDGVTDGPVPSFERLRQRRGPAQDGERL